VSLSGVVASAIGGALVWSIALPFSAGALAGMLAGRAVSARLAGAKLQIGFAAVSALVGFAMIAKAVF
jgi:uncharacterized membrane protein YfcA